MLVAALPAEMFEVLNPDIHIATLTDKAEVSLELHISRGKGYSSAEKNVRTVSK